MDWEIKWYIGKNTFCGTYAILNAIDKSINEHIFELSTGVPFGIKCVDMKSERLLTPYRNPNDGIDLAMNLWGISFDKFVSKQKYEIFKQLCYEMSKGKRVVLGPLNMGKLFYIPLCSLYEGVDHYVYLQKIEEDTILIRDSEGYVAVLVSQQELYKIWNINQVYEAEGRFTFRSFDTQELLLKYSQKFLLEYMSEVILKQMKENMEQAEESGQGSGAFLKAFRILKEYDINRWKLSFLYELEYLIQRKILALYFFKEINIECFKEFGILKEQIILAAQVYRKIKKADEIEVRDFMRLGEREQQLVEFIYKIEI